MAGLNPPHDCRLTIRCLRECFEFNVELETLSFEALRSENTVIDQFFDRRQNDEAAGETGERILQVKTRPVFSLHSGRTRGATWFDQTHPPQGVVWLLGVEMHDERHKGSRDAYDVFGRLDASGQLFPTELDYKLLELDRRRLDSATFADSARRDAATLIRDVAKKGRVRGAVAEVAVRAVWEASDDGTVTLQAAVSLEPVIGARSGLPFPLTQERFLLLAEAVRHAAEDMHTPEVLAEEVYDFPGGLRNERAFMLVFSP